MPHHLLYHPSTRPNLTPTPQFNYSYPPPYTRVTQLPQLRNLRAFEDIHLFDDYRIKRYIEFLRANYRAIPSEAAISELRDPDGFPANNAEARIALAQTVLRHLQAHPDLRRGALYFVTINPARYAFRVGDEGARYRHLGAQARLDGAAAAFKARSLQNLVREALSGIAFVGMVEAALFKRWGPEGPFAGDWVSWHVHLIVWGATRAEIEVALRGLRAREKAFVLGGSVTDVREFSRSELTWKVPYAFKAPLKAYRVGRCEHEWISQTSGEVRAPGLRINKELARPGDRVRLLDVFAGKSLTDLFFGGGAGTLVARAIRADLRQQF